MFQHRGMGPRRRLVAVASLLGLAAGLVVAPTPASAAPVCRGGNYLMVARSIIFGVDLASMVVYYEWCIENGKVTSIRRAAPTELVSEGMINTIDFGSGGDPAEGTINTSGTEGAYTVTARVTSGLTLGQNALGTSCTMTFRVTVRSDGSLRIDEFNTCTPFWDRGGRKSRLIASSTLVPYRYIPVFFPPVDILNDPLPDGEGTLRITFPDGGSEVVEVTTDAMGVYDTQARDAIYPVAPVN